MAYVQEGNQVDFSAASKYWRLEKLYIDLADAKGKGLTPLEKVFLQGLLCGYSPAEIAQQVYHNRSSSSVRVYLSNGLYKYIQELLLRQTKQEIKIRNWSHVTYLLDNGGYKKSNNELATTDNKKQLDRVTDKIVTQDWEEQIDIGTFLGREQELKCLKQWLLTDNCRLVALLGMGGLGKTVLAVKLVEEINDRFDRFLWRSLRSSTPLDDFLNDAISSLSDSPTIKLPERTEGKISLLMKILREKRCLLVLNQFESILLPKHKAGVYRKDYEGYGELLRRIAEEIHESCCLLTSREKPKEIALLENDELSVRSFILKGLNDRDAKSLIANHNLFGNELDREDLINVYANNPLALKMVILTIKDLFNGNITEFLALKTILISKIRDLLDEQFNRLSEIEKKVMYVLAINQKLIELRGIGKELSLNLLPQEQLTALESLQWRSLLEKNSFNFRQESLLRPYIIEKLVEQIQNSIENKDLSIVVEHVFSETLIKNYKAKKKNY
jgi:hypothetical protein